MHESPIKTAWKISCKSIDGAEALRQWLAGRIGLERVMIDSIRVSPSGAEQTQTMRHRLGDYFADIRTESASDPASFHLLFERRQDASRFWKDLMVNLLEEIKASTQKPTIERTSEPATSKS